MIRNYIAPLAGLLLAVGAPQAAAQSPPLPAERTLHFPTSAPPDAQAFFDRGMEWMHSFEYERAIEDFQAAQRLSPDFALAYWGEAMCYHQSLWLNEDVAAARAILARLGSTADARARKAPTPRERAYLAAADVLFGEGDATARRAAYAQAMQRLSQQFPDDDEAMALYGLALLGTVSRGQQINLAGDVEQPVLAGSAVQMEAAAIFKRLLDRNPHHPGGLHYLIHTFDDPEHAHLALDAARAYPAVAPESSHARHMSAHIFVQLGLWAEAAAADESAFAASENWVAERGLSNAMKDYHALSWLSYEYLQMGRFRESLAAVDLAGAAANESASPRLQSLHATMLSRYVLESGDWARLRTNVSRNDYELFAIGLSAVRRGELSIASKVQPFFDQRVTDPRYQDRWSMLEILRRELAGLTRFVSGQREEGLAILQDAAQLEQQLPPPLGPIVPIKPAAELLGEALVEAGRPDEAEAAFAAVLARAQNRSRTLLGLARVATLRGDHAAATVHYRAFLDNWRSADPGLPEAAEALQAIEGGGRPVDGTGPGALPRAWLIAAVGLIALGLGAALWWRQRGRRMRAVAPAPSAPPSGRSTSTSDAPSPPRSPRAARKP